MKAILRFLVVLVVVCGTSIVWKTVGTGGRRFQIPEDAVARPKDEVDPLQAALQSSARVAAKADEGWSRSQFQARLEEAFQKGDPCAVVELLQLAKNVAPREFWSAGMAVLLAHSRERQPNLEELLASPESPLYGVPNEKGQSREVRFLNALLYSDLMREMNQEDDQPRRHGHRNMERAIELFKQLAQEDPDNGAYPYFLGSALKQSGANKDDVRAAFTQASKAGQFETFYQGIFDELQSLAYTNAATFTWAYSFLAAKPVPEFSVGIRYLKYWAHSEEPGKWVAQRLAKKLADVGTQYKLKSPGYQFSHSEYLLGQNLKYTVDGKMESNWQEYAQRMRESEKFIAETPRTVVDAEIQLYMEKVDPKHSCGSDVWKALFAAYRAKREG